MSPQVITHFKAHKGSVQSVAYIELGGYVLSTGAENIHLHTMEGHLIGSFGGGNGPWDVGNPSTWQRDSPQQDHRKKGKAKPKKSAYFGQQLQTMKFGQALNQPPAVDQTEHSLPQISVRKPVSKHTSPHGAPYEEVDTKFPPLQQGQVQPAPVLEGVSYVCMPCAWATGIMMARAQHSVCPK